MLRVTLKGMAQRKVRMLLSTLAVLLGVAFVSGALVLTDTLGRSFDRVFSDAYAYIDVRVSGEPVFEVDELEGPPALTPVPDDIVARVAAVPGVAEAIGVVDVEGARLIGADGKTVPTFGPPQLGTNWLGETELVQLREGRGPQAPDEIAINAGLADAAQVGVGDRVGVLTREPRQEFTVVGIFEYAGGRESIGGAQEVSFTDATAQRLMLGETGMWSAVRVTAESGVDPQRLRDDVAAVLGDGYQVHTGEELAEKYATGLKEGLRFFTYILLGFAAVALFVGVFLILNTFSIVVAQRLRELALLRALGAGRRQVIASVLSEAVVIGVLASVLGLAAGIGVGALLAAAATSFMSLPLAGLGVPVTAVVSAFVTGLLVTLVAAVLPALRASRIPPVAAMQEAATPDRPLTRITVAGAVLLAGGVGLLGAGLVTDTLWQLLVGVLATFAAVALLTPMVARPVVNAVGRLFSWSVAGTLGRLNAGRNPRRTAITAAALMVGVALVSGVNVILQSAKVSLDDAVREAVDADLMVLGDMSGATLPTFDVRALERAADLPGVVATTALYQDLALVNGERTYVTATSDFTGLARIHRPSLVAGELERLGPDQLAISDHIAERHGLAIGDPVTVQFNRGEPHQLTVGAVYEDGSFPGRWMLPAGVTPDMTQPQPFMGAVLLADGAPVEPVREQLEAWLADSPEVTVTDLSGFIAQQAALMDMVLRMVQLLLALAIIIAVLGIVNTLALSVLERTREIGMLRAVGLTRSAITRMVTVESVVISVFGALLGIVVGSALGAAVVNALAEEGVEQLALPWASFGIYLALSAAVGVVAAVLPAIRAARTNVLAAIAHE
ncbi:MAG TPA: ABC transporter permease [Natronosporangium sp.]|nr:ABC transporter permease [Natronosporangium sp.]